MDRVEECIVLCAAMVINIVAAASIIGMVVSLVVVACRAVWGAG